MQIRETFGKDPGKIWDAFVDFPKLSRNCLGTFPELVRRMYEQFSRHCRALWIDSKTGWMLKKANVEILLKVKKTISNYQILLAFVLDLLKQRSPRG